MEADVLFYSASHAIRKCPAPFRSVSTAADTNFQQRHHPPPPSDHYRVRDGQLAQMFREGVPSKQSEDILLLSLWL